MREGKNEKALGKNITAISNCIGYMDSDYGLQSLSTDLNMREND